MPGKLLVTVVGFNMLVVIFLGGVVLVYLRPRQFGLTMSLFLGWLTGFVNLSTSEAQFPVLLLLAFGFFLGFTRPKGAWKYALILGSFVPASQFIWIFVMHRSDLVLQEGAASLFAFLPAFAGTYLGKFIADGHAKKLSEENSLTTGKHQT